MTNSPLLIDGAELFLSPVSKVHVIDTSFPCVVWNDLNTNIGLQNQDIELLPKSPVKFRCKNVHSKIGDSYVLTSDDWHLKFFLKLPNKGITSAPSTADQLARHFAEEFSTLRELKDVRGNSRHRIGCVSEILTTADFYIPRIGFNGADVHQQVRWPALIEGYVEGVQLDKWCADLETRHLVAMGSDYQSIWFLISFALAMTLRRVHNKGIVHASIRPEHILLGKPWQTWDERPLNQQLSDTNRIHELLAEVYLVGFGTSSLLFDPTYIKALEQLLDNSFTAPELRKSKRKHGLYSYPVDLFSLGVTMQYLLETLGSISSGRQTESLESFEKKVFPKQVEQLKKDIAESANKFVFPQFSQWENIARVIDKSLRNQPGARYQCSEEMICFILNAATESDRIAMVNAMAISTLLDQNIEILINAFPTMAEENINNKTLVPLTPLRKFVSSKLKEQTSLLLRSLSRHHNECWGSRDMIIDHLGSFIGNLVKGDEYCTVTFPGYWTNDNLGINGRFLVLNKHLTRKGVRIRRVLLVAESFDQLPFREQEVLLAQQEAMDALSHENPGHTFDVRVHEVPNDLQEFRLNEHQRRIVAFTKKARNPESNPIDWDYTGVSFLSHGEEYHDFGTLHLKLAITKVRLKELDAETAKRDVNDFEVYWKESKPLHSYIGGGIPIEELLASGQKSADSIRRAKISPMFQEH